VLSSLEQRAAACAKAAEARRLAASEAGKALERLERELAAREKQAADSDSDLERLSEESAVAAERAAEEAELSEDAGAKAEDLAAEALAARAAAQRAEAAAEAAFKEAGGAEEQAERRRQEAEAAEARASAARKSSEELAEAISQLRARLASAEEEVENTAAAARRTEERAASARKAADEARAAEERRRKAAAASRPVELSAEEAARMMASRRKPQDGPQAPPPAAKKPARAAPRAKQSPAPPADGRPRLSGYEIFERLGSDSLSLLHRARQSKMNRTVALRVLRPERVDDRAAVEQFQHEARLAGHFDHPNIVRVHEMGCDGKLHYYSMEFVQGISLDSAVRGAGALELKRSCDLVRDVASGLVEWERRNLTYGELCPPRVLLDGNGTPKIRGLGLAARGKLTVRPTSGTANFMAPEVLAGSKTTARADVYSLGALLFFLLTGETPHDEAGAEKILRSARRGPGFLYRFGNLLPRPITGLLGKALQGRPDQRHRGVGAFAEALEVIASGSALMQQTPDRAPRTFRPTHRFRRKR